MSTLAKQPAGEWVTLFSTTRKSAAIPEGCRGCCTGTSLRREQSPTTFFEEELKRTKARKGLFDAMKALVGPEGRG